MHKQLITLCLILLSSLALANPSTTHLNESSAINNKDLITIEPHTRSTELNARHANECAEIGGVDITDESEVRVSKSVKDVALCRIVDENKFKLTHPDIDKQFKTNSNSPDCLAIPPSGEVANGNYQVNGYGEYNLPGMTSGILEAGIPNDTDYMDDPCRAITTPVILSPGKYAVLLRCISNSYGRQQSWTRFEVKTGCSDKKFGWIIHPENPNITNIPKNLGIPENLPGCNIPLSQVGNPINVAIGNKYQQDTDIIGIGEDPLNFIRYYNSSNNTGWSNNYTASLTNYSVQTVIKLTNGNEVYFIERNGVYVPSPTNLGTLVKSGSNYIYTSPWNEVSEFNADGKLIKTVNSTGLVHNISYAGNVITVKDTFGNSLTITNNDKDQPISVVSSNGQKVDYAYDSSNRLVKVTKNGKSKTYYYEDAKYPYALTGVTDERGVRYATWGYDGSGRANLSEHAGGKDKVSITYISDSQTRLTNPLNRSYTYNYKVIDGVKRITSIYGAASSQCPAIGSSYEYNSRGLVTLATDGKGIKTSYEYNDKGQETSRTIGLGSPEAVKITTIWDDRFFNKPKTVTYPDKVITFSYDNNGNLLNQTVEAK